MRSCNRTLPRDLLQWGWNGSTQPPAAGVPTTTPLPRSTPPIRTAGEGQNLPDDAPIHIGVAGDPGDFGGYRDFVIVEAHQVENWRPATSTAPERTETADALTLFAD